MLDKNLRRFRVRTFKLRKINRIPAWADLEKMKLFYIACPEGMVVDHIIPIRGKNVSGLHVLSNLQYLTPEENAKKRNYFGDFQKWTEEDEKEYFRQYAKDHAEELSEYRKAYRAIHKEKAREYARQYWLARKIT